MLRAVFAEVERGHMGAVGEVYLLIWVHCDVAGWRGHVANRFGLRTRREKWGDWGREARVRAVACGLLPHKRMAFPLVSALPATGEPGMIVINQTEKEGKSENTFNRLSLSFRFQPSYVLHFRLKNDGRVEVTT